MSSMYFRYLDSYNIQSLEKGKAFYLNKFESPLSKDDLHQIWLILPKWFWKED